MSVKKLTLDHTKITATFDENGNDVTTINSLSDLFDGLYSGTDSTTFSNSHNDFTLEYDFGVGNEQYLSNIKVQFTDNTPIAYTIQASENGTDYTIIHTITSDPGSNINLGTSEIQTNSPKKYRKWKFNFTTFNTSTLAIREIQVFAYPLNVSNKYYNVEFDDALLDLAGWKNPRYNGSKLTGVRINQFNQGDTSYGLNPVIENKTACIFLGKDIDEGEAINTSNQLVEISNHSYLTINKILFVDLETDEIEIISRENMSNIGFNRIVAENFPEGSSMVIKSLEDLPEKLKPNHAVKFNQGQLMKVYSYTPNTDGHQDGVFGGIGIREQKSTPIPNLGSTPASSTGLFGFGMTAIVSSSLFNTSSIQFTGLLPSELSDYESNYSTETMGTNLVPQVAQQENDFVQGAYVAPIDINTPILVPEEDSEAS